MQNILLTVLLVFYRIWLFLFYGRVGLWRVLSRIVRSREKKADKLPTMSVLEMEYLMLNSRYEPDGFRQMYDTARHPLATWRRKQENLPLGDCEDFSMLAYALLRRNSERQEAVVPMACMTVFWLEGFKLHGHTVALFGWKQHVYHISNWGMVRSSRNMNPYKRISDIAGGHRVVAVFNHTENLDYLGGSFYGRYEGPNAQGYVK